MEDKNNVPQNTLFSSSTCNYCKLFMKELNKNMMIDQFNIVDIEKTPFDVSKIQVVPTIVVNNNRVLAGRNAFAWLQNELKNMVTGVETFGVSSAFTYVDEKRGEYSMSSPYIDIQDTPTVTTEKHVSDSNKPDLDIESAMSRLQQERSQ
jgi:glutaredoxin